MINPFIKFITNKYFIIGAIIVVATAFFVTRYWTNKIDEVETKLEIARTNEKAYQKDTEIWKDRYGQEHAKSLMFLETTESFKRSNDSVTRRMLQIMEQQDIKLKNLERVAYSKSGINTRLVREIGIPTMPDTSIDLSTPYIKNILHLSPVTISSDISFENEVLTTLNVKKEPVGPPKKTIVGRWLQNWFGKKHIVIEGETIQTNPLVETKEQKFIEFYKD